MKDRKSMTGTLRRFAAGLALASCFFGCTEQPTKTSPQQPPTSTSNRRTAELKRDWPKNSPAEVYEKIVVAKAKKKDGRTEVRCTLPLMKAGKILYDIKSVSVKDAQQKPVTTTCEGSTVTFLAPKGQLSGITLDATYIDSRSFEELPGDPDSRIDWNIRFLSFKLNDVLKTGIQN